MSNASDKAPMNLRTSGICQNDHVNPHTVPLAINVFLKPAHNGIPLRLDH